MYSTIVFSVVVCCVLAFPQAKINSPLTEPNNAPTETNNAPTDPNNAPTDPNNVAVVKRRDGKRFRGRNAKPQYAILHGNFANEGFHNYIAALSTGSWIRGLVGGASIVTKRSILTAAHCIQAVYVNGSLTDSLRATVGTNRWEEGGVMYSFTHNATYPHYISSIKKNDIGVLFTSEDIVFTPLIQPIALDYEFVGEYVAVTVAGWGKTEEGYHSLDLMELDVDTIEGAECVADVAEVSKILNIRVYPVEPHIEICTYHSRSHGTCKGDSGGPLVRMDNGKQVGIVSWGFPCAIGAPDVYARISAYKEWLEKVIV